MNNGCIDFFMELCIRFCTSYSDPKAECGSAFGIIPPYVTSILLHLLHGVRSAACSDADGGCSRQPKLMTDRENS